MYDTIGAFLETKQSLNKSTNINGIFQKENGILIQLSLPKYLLGNNIETIDRKQTGLAIEKLSDQLQLNIKNSKLYRIDVGGNMVMEENISKYLTFLDECKNFKKGYIDSTLYFNHYLKILVFYDKLKVAKKKGMPIPIEFKNYKNKLLRYELRFNKRFKTQFGKALLLKDLTDKNIYQTVLEHWKEYYFSINKKKILKINSNAFHSIKSLKNYLIEEGINNIGLDYMLSHIDLHRNNFKNSSSASNCKKILREYLHRKTYNETNDLIIELDQKIIETKNRYLDDF